MPTQTVSKYFAIITVLWKGDVLSVFSKKGTIVPRQPKIISQVRSLLLHYKPCNPLYNMSETCITQQVGLMLPVITTKHNLSPFDLTHQFKHILLAPLRGWLVVITSFSLWEHPDALFVKVRIKAGQGGGGWFCSHQALEAPAVTRHLEPGKAQNGVPAGPTPVWVKRPGEERMLQARLSPHPISIFSSELHHPESLAPNSQLPLWSISRWRLHFNALFLGTCWPAKEVCKNETYIILEHPVPFLPVYFFLSGYAENLRSCL